MEMSRLSPQDLLQIAEEKNLVILNITEYKNLQSDIEFRCCECNKTFVSNFETIRNKNFTCPCCETQEVKYTYKPPKKSGYRVIGCDQATQHFGISVFDDGKLVYYDCIEFKGELDYRYSKIYDFMDAVLKAWNPDYVVIEDIQLQQSGAIGGYNAFKVLGGLLGVMKAVLRKNNVKYTEVLNKVWQAKFMISGKDRSTQKKNVINKVKSMFGIEVSDDVADAILIGKYGCAEKVSSSKLF